MKSIKSICSKVQELFRLCSRQLFWTYGRTDTEHDHNPPAGRKRKTWLNFLLYLHPVLSMSFFLINGCLILSFNQSVEITKYIDYSSMPVSEYFWKNTKKRRPSDAKSQDDYRNNTLPS